MNLQLIQNILSLSENRILFLRENSDHGFYKGSQTFYDGILDEMEEVKVEIDSGNKVLLEDELGDVFWDYVCLLEGFEREGKISKKKVFERCWKKFSERLNSDGSNNGNWQEIKIKQKEQLRKEQELTTMIKTFYKKPKNLSCI